MTIFRPARESDLAAMYFVYYLNEVSEAEAMAANTLSYISAISRHILETGSMYVAEQDTTILAFAGAITRGAVTFLTDLFVRPKIQSSGLGKTLLSHVLLPDQAIHCTMSSTDPRAQALYTRVGMQPVFPHYNLEWQRRAGEKPSFPASEVSEVEVVEGQVGDPALVRWDAQICGRPRRAAWRPQGSPLLYKRMNHPVEPLYSSGDPCGRHAELPDYPLDNLAQIWHTMRTSYRNILKAKMGKSRRNVKLQREKATGCKPFRGIIG